MGLEKYKICPNCGEHNPSTLIQCLKCEEDLFHVPIMDEESEKVDKEKNEKENTATSEIKSGNMVRICEDCGAHNPANARKCNTCGEDISDIVPVPETCASVQSTVPSYILATLDGEYAFQLTDDSTLIGRTEIMREYLEKKNYVSRQHARITLRDGKMYVRNLSKTNYTFVNNVQIADNEEIELHDGDELALGGIERNGSRQEQAAYFRVRVGSCS